jgi:hypothetical protein
MPTKKQPLRFLEAQKKTPLTRNKSPFLVFIEYGENREGYWAYNNMVLQFEDAVDVLKVVMHPAVENVFWSQLWSFKTATGGFKSKQNEQIVRW